MRSRRYGPRGKFELAHRRQLSPKTFPKFHEGCFALAFDEALAAKEPMLHIVESHRGLACQGPRSVLLVALSRFASRCASVVTM